MVATFSATPSKACFKMARRVEGVHGVEPLAEPARWNCNLDNMRKLTFDGFRLTAALISEHFEHRLHALI